MIYEEKRVVYQNEDLLIRELHQANDENQIYKWLSDPKVLEFYEGRDVTFKMEDVKRKFFNREDEITRCMIVYQGKDIGYIQFYPINTDTSNLAEYQEIEGVYGLDQFIGESKFWNKGIGTLLVSSMVNYLFTEKMAARIIMDPMTTNERAIKCYEKCGFRKVKVLSKQMLHEGEYRDYWLMEAINNTS
ncbi:2-aminoglycoside phosphotransferase [Bacillus sp. LL01]|nr:2-aminoglycoside phosphotransferase [Bacillus sp. LL01]